MNQEIEHPRFLELLQTDDQYLTSLSLEELRLRTHSAATFAEEGLWSQDLVNYIESYPIEEYVQFHWIAERHYAKKLRDPALTQYLDHYYIIGYARIIALMMRYHINMGHDSNDFHFVLGFLNKLFPNRKDDISIFEIGTGSAELFLELAQIGYRNLEGIEMSPAAARIAQLKLRDCLNEDCIRLISFNEFQEQFPHKRYDVIINSNLIEHIPPAQMDDFIAGTLHHLKPGGYMVVITPSRLSGPHDVTRYFRAGGTPPEGFHLREFSLKDLEELLAPRGYGNFMTVRSLPSLNFFWDEPSEENFHYKRNMEAVLCEMDWKLRKPILDGMYFKGLICQKMA